MSNQELMPVLPGVGKSVALPGGDFEVAAHVTRSVLPQIPDEPFYIEFQTPFVASKMNPEFSKYRDKKTGEPSLPDVAEVVNLATGEYQILIGNTVLQSEITKAYPDETYVGRCFAVLQTKSEIDKRYRVYKIVEIRRKGSGVVKAGSVIDGTTQSALDNAKARKHK